MYIIIQNKVSFTLIIVLLSFISFSFERKKKSFCNEGFVTAGGAVSKDKNYPSEKAAADKTEQKLGFSLWWRDKFYETLR